MTDPLRSPRPATQGEVATGVIRVIAPNPSPMTHWGTNTFILGTGADRVLIDPGPDSAAHREAIMAALPDGTRISHILVTHAHLDHSAGVPALAALTDAPVMAFGDATSGRTEIMQRLAREEDALGGGEGVDHGFAPDIKLADRAVVETAAGPVTALHTPGHMSGHLSFLWEGLCFTGDLIMGWSTSLISPPDGDASTYRESLTLLRQLGPSRLMPAHGDAIDTPEARISELLDHRAMRESQILAELAKGPCDLTTLTRAIYSDLPAPALPYAARNTLAHLIDLYEQKRISATPHLSQSARFSRA
ncbi:MBL fold metallo-hydrolase [Celeribacter sp.]|uniref:MBL fold metallo-hydrolase n=1 Tax=Celeribacter sp. TaxID=1890673 RepID=UPI003A935485